MDQRPLAKGILLILSYFQTFLSFCILDDFFRFSKKTCFGVFFVHPETTLPDELETSVQRAYCQFWHISRRFLVFAFWRIFSVFQNNRVLGYSLSNKTWWNHASRLIRDLWSKGVSLILSYFQMFLSFCVFGNFFPFKKNVCFGYSWTTLLWHRCYYPHWSRDALSPVCRIFLIYCFVNFKLPQTSQPL